MNRSEFTESLKTGSKPEAQMKKLAFLHMWKQAIANARQRIAGPIPAQLPETSYNIAKMIATSQENALISLVMPQKGNEVDPRFTQAALDELGSFIIDVMLQCHGWQSPEEANIDLYNQKPFLEYQAFKDKWYALEEKISLERKVERVNDYTRLQKSVEHYSITAGHAISIGSIEEIRSILDNPSNFKIKSPITTNRIASFEAYQTKTKGIIQKTVDTQVNRLKMIGSWLEAEQRDINHESIATYLDTLDLSVKTKKQYLFAGSSFWKWALKHDENFKKLYRDQQSPFEKHDFPVNRSKRGDGSIDRKAFSQEDIKKLYEAAKSTKNRETLTDLILLGAYTGARIEELCQLETKDIVTEESVKCLHIYDGKTAASERLVPIHPQIEKIIKRLSDETKDGFLIPSTGKNKYGNRSDALSKQFGRLKTALGYSEQFVFHSLRKTVITQLQRQDVPGVMIAAIVGHETGTVTFDVYSEGPSPKQKRLAISKLKYPVTF
ncbi:tyrosine-type recombinase/integrase [Pseudomonas juntendi]|nr:tyrosine-type recombinase/integrase [Pseudomonas juntendi]MBI6915987.1 tyrosine-type recombinase/integrase [Pseudomonas juntendi]MCL8331852.1 tyrosine-type recombinase/integrase [Pseudomonas juntendi]MDG9918942.1 tyrosine-type recombinase/integrase [Pseudomonas juntendi]MDH0508527.1 tyrosine-type recombinase/integrase [Pseudomonas juntendi]MDH1045021.1 tyrosine-type recombinase/integrase [Pseudomonas juntendi]